MDETFLYQQIAESIRHDILEAKLKPGDRLPSVRELCRQWNCTPGTVQRAYAELARMGLVVSRAGKGTQVAGVVPAARAQVDESLRRANLVHRSEGFLLETLTSGYSLEEIQQALDMAMDRWRAVRAVEERTPSHIIRFFGSHDIVLNGLAREFFTHRLQDTALDICYTGSLGGIKALAAGQADLAGCHLWDEDSQEYNLPFIRRILPGVEMRVVTLAHRRMGLIVAPGNPHKINGLADLTKPGLRFVNRQAGSGTRVWLDGRLRALGIAPQKIQGYSDERLTHSDVARAVAEGSADVGLGVETAALAYGLDFIFLNRERYDLVMRGETSRQPAMQTLIDWLGSDEGKSFVSSFRGYDSEGTGDLLE